MRKKMRLALYEPDIPQNAGTLMRLGACLGVPVDIIEPCGFVFDERRMRRAGMDYLDRVDLTRHVSWTAYEAVRLEQGRRLILLTTKADFAYTDFEFTSEDTVLLGRESAGVPDEVHQTADARIIVPMTEDARSLNVAVAAAMVLGEGLRQTDGFSPISN
jgi:tRNA (cytidine/uridine-2'-O-)-methyltransferase